MADLQSATPAAAQMDLPDPSADSRRRLQVRLAWRLEAGDTAGWKPVLPKPPWPSGPAV